MATTVLAPTGATDRWVGALAHLGVPFMGPFLPLVIGTTSQQPFRKDHARQALAFQLCFMILWIPLVMLTVLAATLPPSLLPGILGLALLGEVPQIARSVRGN